MKSQEKAFEFRSTKTWWFRKKSILLAPWPFGGVSIGAAKFQELGASASNSLKFLTLHRLKRWFPKCSNVAHKRLFTSLSKLTGHKIGNPLSRATYLLRFRVRAWKKFKHTWSFL